MSMATTSVTPERRDDLAIMHSITGRMKGFPYRCSNGDRYTVVFATDGIDSLTSCPASEFIRNAVQTMPALTEPADEQ
jgi:hypothetical protein